MGALTSGLTTVLPILKTVTGIANTLGGFTSQRRKQDSALDQLQATQAERLRQTQEDASLRKDQIQATAENAEAARKKALKRAVARQRTRFGSQGISTSGGSGQAILLGLFEESDEDRAQRDRLDGVRTHILDQNVNQLQRLNVLQASQLAERQRFSRLF